MRLLIGGEETKTVSSVGGERGDLKNSLLFGVLGVLLRCRQKFK